MCLKSRPVCVPSGGGAVAFHKSRLAVTPPVPHVRTKTHSLRRGESHGGDQVESTQWKDHESSFFKDAGDIINVECNSISGDGGNHVTFLCRFALQCQPVIKKVVAALHLGTSKAACVPVYLVFFEVCGFFLSCFLITFLCLIAAVAAAARRRCQHTPAGNTHTPPLMLSHSSLTFDTVILLSDIYQI